MRRPTPYPAHPLSKYFRTAAESVTSSMSNDSARSYRRTARHFLSHLATEHPQVRSLDQLRRAPHILSWLTLLRSHDPPPARQTLAIHVMNLRRMLEELAWTEQLPTLAHLLGRNDVPRKEHRLPRPLTPEQDKLVQQELQRRNDLASNTLLLLRHTGMRIGECVRLSADCLRAIGPGQWAIHVPLGKLKTERLVPVDSTVCEIIHRLQSLRPPETPSTNRFLLVRPRSRYSVTRMLRTALRDVVRAVGIRNRIVPHQFRHTYGTEMLRAGVSFAAVMKLLGHKSPHMTMQYIEITQQDLQREFQLARSHPRHIAPHPKTTPVTRAGIDGVVDSLLAAQHVLEMFRRTLPKGTARNGLARLSNRLSKIVAELRKLRTS
jgi:site-specific recombinase XerD